eukprot:COSAG05_NODE_15079_length_379_cov_0.575000_1_plen_99_part_01
MKPYLGAASKAFSGTFDKVIARIVELRLLDQAGTNEAACGCGASNPISSFSVVLGLPQYDSDALFASAVALLRRVCPSSLQAEWWITTCAVVDAISVQL